MSQDELANGQRWVEDMVARLLPERGMKVDTSLTASLFQGWSSWYLFHERTDLRVHLLLSLSSRFLSAPNWGVALPAGLPGSSARCLSGAQSGGGVGCTSS